MNTKAIVTLVIGDEHCKRWKRLCSHNWTQYAERHGYDIICIDTPLDTGERARNRSPSWQKCLILSQDFAKNYERIVWIDSDILINAIAAPDIVEAVPLEKVGSIDEWSQPTSELNLLVQARRRELDPSYAGPYAVEGVKHYTNFGLPNGYEQLVQAGVLVLSPAHHRAVFEHVYNTYENRGPEWNYEQRPLSYELIKNDYAHWIDHRFNLVWWFYRILYAPYLFPMTRDRWLFYERFKRKYLAITGVTAMCERLSATAAFTDSYFLHFANRARDMRFVDTSITSWDAFDFRLPTPFGNHKIQE